MLGTSKRKGSLQVMLMALVVLMIGITAPGYGDDDHDDGKNHHGEKHLGLGPTERLSRPALVGTLRLIQPVPTVADVIVVFTGKCRGSDNFPVFPPDVSLTVATLTTPKSLEGLRLPGVATSGFPPDGTGVHSRCLRTDQTVGVLIDLIVVDVKTFTPGLNFITADVVLLQVIPRLDKDKDEDKDKDKDKDK